MPARSSAYKQQQQQHDDELSLASLQGIIPNPPHSATPYANLTLSVFVAPQCIGTLIGRAGRTIVNIQREASRVSLNKSVWVKIFETSEQYNNHQKNHHSHHHNSFKGGKDDGHHLEHSGSNGFVTDLKKDRHRTAHEEDPTGAEDVEKAGDDDEEEEEEEDGWSRVLIRGDAVGAFVAARLVVQLLVRNNNNIMSNKQDHEDEYELFDSDVVLDVPLNRYKQHGAVVGKRGATIAALSADHNVRIHVPHKNAVIYNQHAEGAHGGATTNGYHHGNGGDLHQSQQRDPSLPNVQLEGELDNVETCLIQMLGIVAGKIDGNAVPPVYVPLGNSLSQFNRQGAPLQHQKSKPLSQRYQESSPNLLGNGRTSSSNNHHMNKSVSSNKGTANTLKQPKSGSKKKVANRTATDDTPMDANGSSPNNNKAKSFSESLVIVSPLNATVPSLAQLRQIGRKTSTIIRRKRVSPAVVITEPNQKESGFEGESTNESNSPEGGTTNEFQAGKSKMKATVDSSDTAMEYTITGRDGLKNVQSVFDSIFAGEPVDDVIDAIQRTKRSSKHRQKKGRVADLKVKNNGKAKDVNNENE
eukprot:CAMPEP_0116056056 /NCGR_PEP_ID=MMETSP0322-20121206/3800_1 /TAXON_ID=163516 /ORGANISM="Leptocylindrus danicus var. apora, Strain B651" /LENGTH=583 /DNA_ID=CAMNT_0003539827 /DNA_START=367 /DNA_END=2118 /DNA_ORIENTATION=-